MVSKVGQAKSSLEDEGNSGIRTRRRTVGEADHLPSKSAQTFSVPLI